MAEQVAANKTAGASPTAGYEVARPRGMDEITMRLELDDAPADITERLSKAIRARAGVLVHVEAVPSRSLEQQTSWFSDLRRETESASTTSAWGTTRSAGVLTAPSLPGGAPEPHAPG